MLKINIRTKLVLGLVIVLLINLGIGFYAFGLYNEQSKRAAQICALSFQIVETSLSAQVHFKKQVQEWKNVLLRGYDTALYDKYLKQFYQQERITQALIRKLIPLISGHSEAQEIAKEFLRVHARLGHEYRQALTLYSNVDDEIYWRSDGTHFPVEYRSFPIHHDDQLHGAVVNFSDITERKSAETNLRQAHAALAQERAALAERVRDRTEELRITNAELARSVRAKDEFLAAMSHELRTPLTSILGNTEILIDQHKGALNEGQRRSLKTIEESANHLLALINDILDVAKVEAGKMPLAWDQVPVKQLCEASLRLIRQSAEHKSQQLSSNIDPEVHIVSGDSRRLKQLLVNLLSNAVKFTPQGGEIGLDVAGDKVRKQVRFTVWDRGIGIDEKQQKQLFKPFVQLDSKLSRRYQGTGLGLALVYRMAELHSGYAHMLKNDPVTRYIPMIMLTARGEEDDRVRGLDSGADDYITKPFSGRELIARIKAVWRRSAPEANDETVQIHGLCLDPPSYRVTANGENIELSPTEFRLLHFFMTHPERVYSRNQLLDRVWGDNTHVEDRTVDVYIRRLRKNLGTRGHDSFLQTVRGAGYRFSS